jgi:restriction endonuclease S subunit
MITPLKPMPSGWCYQLIDSLAERGSGHTPDRKKPTYWNGGIKWVSLTDSGKLDHLFISNTQSEISEDGIRHSSAVLHPTNTVILSRDAGVGKSAILAEPMAVSQHFIAWQCGPKLEPLMLYYWLQYHKSFFEKMAVGSTIKTIGLGVFRKLAGSFPPISEQRKITVKLYGKGVFAKQERITGSISTKYFVRRAGQFIYSKLDFLNGAFGIVPALLDGFESTQDLPAFDISKNCDPHWLLAYVSRSEFYAHQIGAAAGGRKARRVNPYEFLALSVLVPSKTEQTAIANILDSCDKELQLLRAQRTALDQQKRGLMQKLLTGAIRVRKGKHG